jgi:outer membrane murein-binding lipoprotein Lpp
MPDQPQPPEPQTTTPAPPPPRDHRRRVRDYVVVGGLLSIVVVLIALGLSPLSRMGAIGPQVQDLAQQVRVLNDTVEAIRGLMDDTRHPLTAIETQVDGLGEKAASLTVRVEELTASVQALRDDLGSQLVVVETKVDALLVPHSEETR